MRTLTRRQRAGAAVLALIAVLFISLDFAGGTFATERSGAAGAMGSLYRGTDSVLGPVRRFFQGIPDVSSNRATIAQLQQQNADLKRQLTAAALDRSTAAQLKRLQLQADNAHWALTPARVVATGSSSGFEWTVTVDVGRADHVTVGQTVTDGDGLIGRVLAVHASTSVVLLAVDPGSGVGVRDTRTGDLLLASGAGTSGLTATPLQPTVHLKKGDTLVTGPVGKSTYVAGIPVGTVTSVTTSATGAVSVTLSAATRMTGLDLLGLVHPTAAVSRALITPSATSAPAATTPTAPATSAAGR